MCMKDNMKHSQLIGADEVRTLVERFLDGATEPSEETAIYAFFLSHRGKTLPADLEAYREMFVWYASLGSEHTAKPKHKSIFRRLRWVGAAAAVAVLVAIGVIVSLRSDPVDDPMYAMYEGSYVITNGVRNTDLRQIYAALAASEHLADSIVSLASDEPGADRDFEREALEEVLASISDPVLATQLRHDLLE